MRLSSLAVLGSIFLGGSLVASADSVAYTHVGTIAPTGVLTAANTGPVIGYFFGAEAGDTDSVRMVDLTSGTSSAWLFSNHSTAIGATADFGSVTAGDVIVFELSDSDSGKIFASAPLMSADDVNHAYTAPFSAGSYNGVNFPSGEFVGMEDLPNGQSDFDYNDDTFVFTNVASSTDPVPEPNTIMLLGTGALGALGAFRRKIFS